MYLRWHNHKKLTEMEKSKIPQLKTLLLALFLVAFTMVVCAQDPTPKSAFWSQVRFGGGLGLGISNGGFNASVSPSAIYQFNDRFAAGTSLTFNYAKYLESKRYAYGGSILTLYNPIHFLQLSAELEQLRINQTLATIGGPNIEDDYWSPALFLGIGYTDRNFTVGIRYDVLYDDDKSIYLNAWMPFVRVYF